MPIDFYGEQEVHSKCLFKKKKEIKEPALTSTVWLLMSMKLFPNRLLKSVMGDALNSLRQWHCLRVEVYHTFFHLPRKRVRLILRSKCHLAPEGNPSPDSYLPGFWPLAERASLKFILFNKIFLEKEKSRWKCKKVQIVNSGQPFMPQCELVPSLVFFWCQVLEEWSFHRRRKRKG